MEATFIHSDVPGSATILTSLYRIFIPAQALADAGHTIHLVQGGSQRPQGPHSEQATLIDYSQITETVLIEREVTPDVIRNLRRAGAKRIILTFDDNYAQIPRWAPHWDFWHGSGNYYPKFLEALSMVDLAIVAGRRLVAEYTESTNRIQLVPNFLKSEWVDRDLSRNRQLPNVVNVVWGGTLEHRASWENSVVPKALAQADSTSATPIHYHIYNHVANQYLDRVHVPYTSHDWVDFGRWPAQLALYDIGLAPLRGVYDYSRSSLKVLEYASLGIPWIATDADPYKDCEGGILLRSDGREGERWARALYELANDPKLYRELSERGREFASGYQMSRNVHTYAEILWPTK